MEVRDDITDFTLFYPEPIGTSADGHPIVEFAGSEDRTIVLRVEGGGQNVETTWEGRKELGIF